MTTSNQMYLKAVYVLSEICQSVRVIDIANDLSVSKASVCSAIKRLEKKGYIVHEPYGDVKLSPSGKKAAKALIVSDLRIRQHQQRANERYVAFARFGDVARQADG